MWYLVPVTYFDRSHDLSQLVSGHADTGQLLPGTWDDTVTIGISKMYNSLDIFVTVVNNVQVVTHN